MVNAWNIINKNNNIIFSLSRMICSADTINFLYFAINDSAEHIKTIIYPNI